MASGCEAGRRRVSSFSNCLQWYGEVRQQLSHFHRCRRAWACLPAHWQITLRFFKSREFVALKLG